ncbi:TIGR04141 family sporadically distributed protein [Caballeronia sp. 15715]|uniref:TIGR04141 family sporadically distributed protein n=1 Tax=Caballeronia sp. 15715 TaxID=3391030 RepID=UPI0039E539B4
MSERQPKKERLSVYLIKDPKLRDEQIVKTERTHPPILLEVGAGDAKLYVKARTQPKLPEWVAFIFPSQDPPAGLFQGNHSDGAVLIFRDKEAVFALSFGTGHHLIDRDLVVRDFGLRVTLNSVDPDKLRSLDKANYETNPLNTRSQSPKDADIFDLQIDTENDMVYALTGTSTVPLLGDRVTGRDALTIMPESTLEILPLILREAHARYSEKPPQKFSFVEDVSRVRDTEDEQILNLELSDLLTQDPPPTNVWVGEPEIVDWEAQTGYSFERGKKGVVHSTLQLDKLLDHMAAKGAKPSEAELRALKIYVIDANYMPVKQWSAYQCLYAEIPMGDQVYILRNGAWHVVSDDFVDRVDKALADVEIDATAMPVYAHDDEGHYNESCAEPGSGYELLDRKMVPIGGPHDKIEFCDLVRDGHDLIHVKVYRSSATLSHLFAQGSVSAQTFLRDGQFRKQLNNRLPASIKLVDPSVRPEPKNFRVVYAIATSKSLPFELPFFAKVALKNAVADLRMIGFTVALSRIDLDPVFLKTSVCKPAGAGANLAPITPKKLRRKDDRSSPPARL